MNELVATGALILASSLRLAVPLIFACIAGLWSERSGIVDIGLEGKMLVAAFASAGYTTAEIGKILDLSVSAVAGRMDRLIDVLGARNRTQAVAICVRERLFTVLDIPDRWEVTL